MALIIANILGFSITWGVWLWLATRPYQPTASLVIALAGTLILIPVVFSGRWLLDQQPTIQRAVWVTTVIHYLVAISLGSAILEATRFAQNWRAWPIPVPPWIGLSLMSISGVVLVLVVFNLILKGVGLPMAFALTRSVVADWLYAWTRNPMVLSALAFLIGLGLWLQSTLFIIWVLAVVSPAILIYLNVFEERELEIRFGDAYLQYKAITPWLLPRRPQKSP